MIALFSHPFATAHADNSVRHLNKFKLFANIKTDND